MNWYVKVLTKDGRLVDPEDYNPKYLSFEYGYETQEEAIKDIKRHREDKHYVGCQLTVIPVFNV